MLTVASSVLLLLVGLMPLGGGSDEPSNKAAAHVIPITAKRFSFEPAQITLKKGETVTLHLTAQDVTHGFYLKPLKIDEVIEPGKPADVTITPQTAGTFTTICDHFCGSGHGNMHMTIVVQ